MLFRHSRSLKVRRILLVSLTNIGDVVLTFPVFDALHAAFPDAVIDVVAGQKAAGFFGGNPRIGRVIVYDKGMSLVKVLAWVADLRRQRYDIVVDLRNTFLPFVVNAAAVTLPCFARGGMHMKDKHFARLASLSVKVGPAAVRSAIVLSSAGRMACARLTGGKEGYVLVAAGAADHKKRWHEEGFLEVIRHVRSRGYDVVLVGDRNDQEVAGRMMKALPEGVVDLCGRTTLLELAGVVERAGLAITNDSGIMHLASYSDKPIVALFGPTDPSLYGPWSARCVALRKSCSAVDVDPADVIASVDELLC